MISCIGDCDGNGGKSKIFLFYLGIFCKHFVIKKLSFPVPISGVFVILQSYWPWFFSQVSKKHVQPFMSRMQCSFFQQAGERVM